MKGLFSLRDFNPSAKLFLNLLFLAAALLSGSFHTSLLLLFSLAAIGVLFRGFKKRHLYLALPFLLFAFSLVWMNGLWGTDGNPDENMILWNMHFSTGGLTLGTLLALRVMLIILAGLLFTTNNDPEELMFSLMQQLRLPPGFAYSVLAILGLASDIRRDIRLIRTNHLMRRGKPVSPLTLTVHLLAIHIRHCENISLAMEARGFSMKGKRTHYRRISWKKRDTAFLILVTLLVCTVFLFSHLRGYPIGYASWMGYH